MSNPEIGELVIYSHEPEIVLVVIGYGSNHPTTDAEYSNTYIWTLPLSPTVKEGWEEGGIRANGIPNSAIRRYADA